MASMYYDTAYNAGKEKGIEDAMSGGDSEARLGSPCIAPRTGSERAQSVSARF